MFDPRYAEFEHDHGESGSRRWQEIYERAVKAVQYSVEIWAYYCQAMVDRLESEALQFRVYVLLFCLLLSCMHLTCASTHRRVFERAAATVGDDYQAHQLWEKFIAFEASTSLPRAVAVYRRVIRLPLRLTYRFHSQFRVTAPYPFLPLSVSLCLLVSFPLSCRFEELVNSRQTKELLTPQEHEQLTQKAQAQEAGAADLEAVRKRIFLEEERTAFAVTLAEIEKRKEYEDKVVCFSLRVTFLLFSVVRFSDPRMNVDQANILQRRTP